MPVLENLQLACAVCRIGVYSVFRKICCAKPPPPRPEYSCICLGLTNAGKTTVLTTLAGEPLDDITPTSGFIIKCVQFKDCILNIKEIGGSDKIRPYWKHYYNGAQAVIFFIDSASSEDEIETAKESFKLAAKSPALADLPWLIVVNCQDKKGARSEDEIKELFEIETALKGIRWVIHSGHKDNKDGMREGFCKLNTFLVPTGQETSPANSPPQSPTEQTFNRV